MVNKLLPYATAAMLAVSPQVISAQDTVRGLVCTIAEQCDLDKSFVSTSLTPLIESRLGDTPGSLSINLYCEGENQRYTSSETLISDDTSWFTGEISRMQPGTLLPYTLEHEGDNTSHGNKLRGGGLKCELSDIEISSNEGALSE